MNEAERIRQAREAQHYSQETLAIAAGISRRTVQNIEAGRPSGPESMRAVMAVLQLAPSGNAEQVEDELSALLLAVEGESSDAAFRPFLVTFLIGFGGAMITVAAMVVIGLAKLIFGHVDPGILGAVTVSAFVCCILLGVGAHLRSGLRSKDDVDKDRIKVIEQYRLEKAMRGLEPQVCANG